MQSTTVTISGKGSNPKTTLYVGGLQESVNEAILHSAFIPFGAHPLTVTLECHALRARGKQLQHRKRRGCYVRRHLIVLLLFCCPANGARLCD